MNRSEQILSQPGKPVPYWIVGTGIVGIVMTILSWVLDDGWLAAGATVPTFIAFIAFYRQYRRERHGAPRR